MTIQEDRASKVAMRAYTEYLASNPEDIEGARELQWDVYELELRAPGAYDVPAEDVKALIDETYKMDCLVLSPNQARARLALEGPVGFRPSIKSIASSICSEEIERAFGSMGFS